MESISRTLKHCEIYTELNQEHTSVIFNSKLCYLVQLWGKAEGYLLHALQVIQNQVTRAVTRVNQISKNCLWIYSNKFIPLYYIRVNKQKKNRQDPSSVRGPSSLVKNEVKIQAKWPLFRWKFCFVHNFLPFPYFWKPFWQLICIFAVFWGDTHQGHIYGHNKMSHNSYHGHFPILATMARLIMAINMVFMGVPLKYSKNADQQSKRFLKIWKCQKVMDKTELSSK